MLAPPTATASDTTAAPATSATDAPSPVPARETGFAPPADGVLGFSGSFGTTGSSGSGGTGAFFMASSTCAGCPTATENSTGVPSST